MHMRPSVVCGLPPLKNIFLHYLNKGMIFEIKKIERQIIILRKTERGMIKNV